MQDGMRLRDPITYEVVVNALSAIPHEMSIRLMRSANSPIFRETMEFSTALCLVDGTVVAQGVTLPVHVGALPAALPMALKEVKEQWKPGDVLIFNDPEVGGLHLPDFFVLMPIFVQGNLVGLSASTGHHTDVGGRVPGGHAADSKSIFEEGLRVAPIKLWRAGELVPDVASLLRKNCRQPQVFLDDLAAQRAACEAGARGFVELCERFGISLVQKVMGEYLDYTAELFMARLNQIPAGVYEFEDYIEWLDDQKVTVRCKVESGNGLLKFDFAGSSPAVDFAINCPFTYTQAAVATVLLGILGEGVPLNSGLFRDFTVTAPEGTVVSWRMPHACAARGVTMYRICDAVAGALAKAIPDRVPAASEGGVTLLTIAGSDTGRYFNFFDAISGSWGGRNGANGLTGFSSPTTNNRNYSVEMVEREYPIRVTEYQIEPDAFGAGRYRSGYALRRTYELLADEALVVVRADRQRFRPWGLAGGTDGTLGCTRIVRADGSVEVMASKFGDMLRRGDRLEILTPSGGGYGVKVADEPAPDHALGKRQKA